ncbi:MFS transporter [Herbaspirillum autotrophicum]|uniref:MFS transporter n=1 Tax=Herbaspirillum autotrophicum TaxID=180195 RepID=UPI00067AF944|nr:MFS transporter [Herbaspirillum autotrophicum]
MPIASSIPAGQAASAVPASSLNEAYRRTAWKIMPLLFLCYVIAYLDRVNVGFAKLQMLTDLKFNDAVYGLGAGIFFVGYLIFEIPSNLALHRFGARRWIARIMITWGILSALMMFVSSPTSFYILRFFLGVAEAGFFPGIILYLTYWFPVERRVRMMALFITANPVSSLIGAPLSGGIMQSMNGFAGLTGWQWLFVIEAIPAVIAGVFVLFYLRDRIADADWLTDAEKRQMQAAIDNEASKKTTHTLRDGFISKAVWHLGAVYFCIVMGQYVVGFWMPTIIKATGVSQPLMIGLLTAIPFGAAVVVMNLFSRSADRSREYRWHLAIASFIGACGVFFGTYFGGNTILAMIGLTVGTAFMISALPVFWGLPTALLGGTAAVAGIAVINSMGNVAGFLSTMLVGWISAVTGSTVYSMYALAGVLVLGSILVLLVPKPQNL